MSINTRTKVILDAWFGRLVVFGLNIAARILGKFMNIDHSLDKIPEKIVVCKFLGMGSIIQATPLLQSLRKSFPNAKIYFVTSGGNTKLLQLVTTVNEIWSVDDSGVSTMLSSTWALLRKLWKAKPDLYIDLETYSYYSTAVATMSCARNRFGFYRAERNIRMGVYTHMMFFNARAPIAQSYLQMARLIGCREIINDLYPFAVDANERLSFRSKTEALMGKALASYIVVNPNASDLRVERRWPWENMVKLIEELSAKFPDFTILLIGAANEKSWVDKVYSALSETVKTRVFNTAGQFSLNELFALLSEARLLITNDTGPMHMSFSLRKPTVCLFGPASPTQYGQNPNAYGIYKNIYCSPCVHDFLSPPCKGDNQCMKMISVKEVSELCEHVLLNDSISPDDFRDPHMRFTSQDGHGSLGVVLRG
ncbi:MAG: glycosyltransferase family 9 protein [Bacteroidetes bacterium]|nr:glycosyltransferase family 9 protein [Bacteroidota bacterium]MBP6649409.1 glycosyltransferase family 9 protein [Bacteroidia bacterium]